MSYEDFRQKRKESLISERVVNEEVWRNIVIPEAEAQKYYDAHKASLSGRNPSRFASFWSPREMESRPLWMRRAKRLTVCWRGRGRARINSIPWRGSIPMTRARRMTDLCHPVRAW